MAFRGWSADALQFYEGLEADNSKTYWQAHKDVYERCVSAPMHALLTELAGEFGEGKVFRPYRDVRFSADKSPYKTHIGLILSGGGYVQLSAKGLAAGCGMYAFTPAQLDRYRRAVNDDRMGEALTRVVAQARSHRLTVTAQEMLKTAPRGYPADHPRRDLLRHKGLFTWQEWPINAWLGTKKAKDHTITFLRASASLNAWLAEHVGASAAAADRG